MIIEISYPYYICKMCDSPTPVTMINILQLCNECKIQISGNCQNTLLKLIKKEMERSPRNIIKLYRDDGGDF